MSWRRFSAFCFLSLICCIGCASWQPKRKNLSSSERARLLVELANGALAEGDPIGALQSLTLAEQIDASLPELHHSKSLAFNARHDRYNAIRSAKTALEIKPNYAEANNTLGKLLVDEGKYNEAVAPLKVAANDPLYRESYKAWTNLGILKYRQNDYTQARVFLNQAIQAAPAQACIAYYYRGHIGLKDMHMNEAVQDYIFATKKLCARFGEAHLALGLAYQQGRMYDLARKTFLDVQKLYPNTKLAQQAIDQLKYLP